MQTAPAPQGDAAAIVPWSTRLEECCGEDDCVLCCQVAVCPCMYHGYVAEHVGLKCLDRCALWALFSLCGFIPCTACCLGMSNRKALREKYHLAEVPGSDCFTHFLCAHCAIAQEMREMQAQERRKSQVQHELPRYRDADHVMHGMNGMNGVGHNGPSSYTASPSPTMPPSPQQPMGKVYT